MMSYGAVGGAGAVRRGSEASTSGSHTPLLCPDSPAIKIDVAESENESVEDRQQELLFPDELHKTILSFLFLMFGFLVTTFSLALTHDRVPSENSLPDIILDNTTYRAWGLKVSEILIIVSIVVAFLTVMFHQHRMIVFRRIFIILGLLYMYRGLTMFITVLPIPDKETLNSPISYLLLQ